jgi:hypothetical protein
MGTIPVALIEENIHVDIRHRVDVGSRYYDHRRGSRDDVSRRWADVDVDLYLSPGLPGSPEGEKHSKKDGQYRYSTNRFSHISTSLAAEVAASRLRTLFCPGFFINSSYNNILSSCRRWQGEERQES